MYVIDQYILPVIILCWRHPWSSCLWSPAFCMIQINNQRLSVIIGNRHVGFGMCQSMSGMKWFQPEHISHGISNLLCIYASKLLYRFFAMQKSPPMTSICVHLVLIYLFLKLFPHCALPFSWLYNRLVYSPISFVCLWRKPFFIFGICWTSGCDKKRTRLFTRGSV